MINKPVNPLTLLPKSKPFNATRAMKRKIAESFAADANDFIWRVSILNSNRPHDTTSFFAKMYVDMLMGAECALKSLIVSLSPASETPEDAYLVIRRLGHKLDDLYAEAERRAARRMKLLTPKQQATLLKANTIGVGYRYDITTFFFLSRESRLDRAFQRGPVSGNLKYGFIMAFYAMLQELAGLANAAERKYFGLPAAMSINQLGKLNVREDSFFAAVGRRL